MNRAGQVTVGEPEKPGSQVFPACLDRQDPSQTSSLSSTKFNSRRAETRDPHPILLPTCKLRLDLSDPVDHPVCEDPPAPRVSWDHREMLGTPVNQVPRV